MVDDTPVAFRASALGFRPRIRSTHRSPPRSSSWLPTRSSTNYPPGRQRGITKTMEKQRPTNSDYRAEVSVESRLSSPQHLSRTRLGTENNISSARERAILGLSRARPPSSLRPHYRRRQIHPSILKLTAPLEAARTGNPRKTHRTRARWGSVGRSRGARPMTTPRAKSRTTTGHELTTRGKHWKTVQWMFRGSGARGGGVARRRSRHLASAVQPRAAVMATSNPVLASISRPRSRPRAHPPSAVESFQRAPPSHSLSRCPPARPETETRPFSSVVNEDDETAVETVKNTISPRVTTEERFCNWPIDRYTVTRYTPFFVTCFWGSFFQFTFMILFSLFLLFFRCFYFLHFLCCGFGFVS